MTESDSELSPLSNIDIDRYYQGNRKYGGCYCKDELSKKSPGGKFWVINLGDSTTPGTHWMVVYDCLPDMCVYFDPYGVSPPEVIREFMRKSKKKLMFSVGEYQSRASKSCGHFCLLFIDTLLAGEKPEDILDKELLETDVSGNEAKVKDFFRS